MSKKHIYRTVNVEQIDRAVALESEAVQGPWILGMDVAKTRFVAALADSTGRLHRHVRFEHPRQTAAFLGFVDSLKAHGRQVVAVMEPTGTYGDALRYQLQARGIAVHRVSTKHVHDAAELYDGVPSKHDAKDASVLTWLHVQAKSRPWAPTGPTRRAMRALVDERELFDVPLQRALGKLEALLARHFPELEQVVDPKLRSVLTLLEKLPSAAAIASAPQLARTTLRQASRARMSNETIEALVQAARHSCGQPMDGPEQRLMQRLVSEIRRCFKELHRIDADLAALSVDPSFASLRTLLGPTTVAVLYAYLGSPTEYACSAAFEKAIGLNLREHSSGNDKAPGRRRPPGLHLTKRGPGTVRRYLFLAALRLIQTDPVVRAWYAQRTAFHQDCRLKAVIAVMRKLTRSLVHVARGKPFDATKLFDTRRLHIPLTPSEVRS